MDGVTPTAPTVTLIDYPLFYIEWTDHATTPTWCDLDAVKDSSALITCYTIAFVIKDTPEEVVISHTLSNNHQCPDPLTIDRRVITYMEKLPKIRIRGMINRGKKQNDAPTIRKNRKRRATSVQSENPGPAGSENLEGHSGGDPGDSSRTE